MPEIQDRPLEIKDRPLQETKLPADFPLTLENLLQKEEETTSELIRKRMALVLKEYQDVPEMAQTAALMTGAVEYGYAQCQKIPLEVFGREEDQSKVGDIETSWDTAVYQGVKTFLRAAGANALIRGELKIDNPEERENSFGVQIGEGEPQGIFIIDPCDGSVNAEIGKEYGTVLAWAPYRQKLTLDDIQIGLVANHLKANEKKRYLAVKGHGARIMNLEDSQEIRVVERTDRAPSLVDEVPSPWAYSKEPWQMARQLIMAETAREVLEGFDKKKGAIRGGDQPRATDASATSSAGVIDRYRSHLDARGVTKTWDTVASYVLFRETGIKMTDIWGFSLGTAVIYDEKDPRFAQSGGLNPRVGNNFVIARPHDHEKIVYGFLKRIVPILREIYLPTDSLHGYFYYDPELRNKYSTYEDNAGRELHYYEGSSDGKRAIVYESILQAAQEDHGSIDRQDAKRLLDRFGSIEREKYKGNLPGGGFSPEYKKQIEKELAKSEFGIEEVFREFFPD